MVTPWEDLAGHSPAAFVIESRLALVFLATKNLCYLPRSP